MFQTCAEYWSHRAVCTHFRGGDLQRHQTHSRCHRQPCQRGELALILPLLIAQKRLQRLLLISLWVYKSELNVDCLRFFTNWRVVIVGEFKECEVNAGCEKNLTFNCSKKKFVNWSQTKFVAIILVLSGFFMRFVVWPIVLSDLSDFSSSKT